MNEASGIISNTIYLLNVWWFRFTLRRLINNNNFMTSHSGGRGRCYEGSMCLPAFVTIHFQLLRPWSVRQLRGTFSFHAVAACIKATRWWQCCCGQNQIPPAVSASTLELCALMLLAQSWLTEWDAALSIPMSLKGLYLSWLFFESLTVQYIVHLYLER